MHNERCTSGSVRGRGKPVVREDHKALASYSTRALFGTGTACFRAGRQAPCPGLPTDPAAPRDSGAAAPPRTQRYGWDSRRSVATSGILARSRTAAQPLGSSSSRIR